MIRGAVLYLPGPDVRSGPVEFIRTAGPGLVEVRGNGSRFLLPRQTLQNARLWLARGRDWQGPFRGWRGALDALAGLVDPCDLPAVVEALARGRGRAVGAEAMAGGWRYRLAHGGSDPPERYGV